MLYLWPASPSYPTLPHIHASLVSVHSVCVVIKPKTSFWSRLRGTHVILIGKQRLWCHVSIRLDHESPFFHTEYLKASGYMTYRQEGIPCRAVLMEVRNESADIFISLFFSPLTLCLKMKAFHVASLKTLHATEQSVPEKLWIHSI